MCSGAIVHFSLYQKIINKKTKENIDNKIIDCYKLQNRMCGSEGIKLLKLDLIHTMNYLVGNKEYKTLLIKKIEEKVPSIPTACVLIIYEYLQNKSKVKFIDWTTFLN